MAARRASVPSGAGPSARRRRGLERPEARAGFPVPGPIYDLVTGIGP